MALYQRTQVGGRGSGHGVGVASELGRTSQWMAVEPGEEKAFDFSHHGKMRHWVRGRSEEEEEEEDNC